MSTRPSKDRETRGVQTLLGDPKRAIVKLAIPMIIAMSVQTLYNLADAFWVSGLSESGSDGLAAIGLFFPFFIMLMSIGVGIGIGGGAAISRRIGAKDKRGANDAGRHSIVLALIVSLIITIPFVLFIRQVFVAMGASGEVTDLATSYARILFVGTLPLLFSNVANALLRGEGDAKRAMMAMMIGAILNIFIDPIFIYYLELGVAGAAFATVLSISVSALIYIYWIFIKRDTYIDVRLRGFRFKADILKDIIRVGLPSSLAQMSMAISMFVLNAIIVNPHGLDDPNGVAVLTAGWRFIMIAILPVLGIATAVTSVCGAAYGARSYDKLKIAFMHAIRMGLIIQIAIGVAVFASAPALAYVFTFAEGTQHIREPIITFLRIMTLFVPFVCFGILSSALFQGIGKGLYSLAVTLLRSIIVTIPAVIFFALVLDMGLNGVWWGIVTGNLIGVSTAFIWAKYLIHRLRSGKC